MKDATAKSAPTLGSVSYSTTVEAKCLTFGSLFAGIGGFDLGLERAGMKCEWQVEIDPYATRVLEKHWPTVRRWNDVRTFPPDGDWNVDVICGGFPCQDISNAGARAGLSGERSGLWHEYARIVGELRPRYVIVENVAALLGRGMDAVLGELSSIGYDAEWHVIPASAVGALHRRERVWIVAYANGGCLRGVRADSCNGRAVPPQGEQRVIHRGDGSQALPDTNGTRFSERQGKVARGKREGKRPVLTRSDWWSVEPDVGRVAHGVPNRVDRLRGLGNAVVPQVVEWIGRRITEAA